MSNPIYEINDYLSVKKHDYSHCMDHIDHNSSIGGVDANIRLHYLKFDGNGQPMLAALAETLYEYIIDYCIASRNRNDPLTTTQAARLIRDARKLFVHPDPTPDDPDQTGEAGEMLLYFLIESILDAVQVVSKMELKTNPKKEINGSDGIHMKWCNDDDVADIYFGEAKIHQDLSGALSSAFKSISSFHDDKMYKHELLMVTKHFKYANEKVQNEVSTLIVRGELSSNVRINHACLIGYNWKEYKDLVISRQKNIRNNFIEMFGKDSVRIVKLLSNRFNAFDKKHLKFDFFFLPFTNVQDFRNAFNEALN